MAILVQNIDIRILAISHLNQLLCCYLMSTVLIPTKKIETRILLIRGKKVMIDTDLAELYEVQTKLLVKQVLH